MEGTDRPEGLDSAIGSFLGYLPRLDPVIKEVTGRTALVMKLELSDPALSAEIDLSETPLTVRLGSDAAGTVGMKATAADFHQVLLGRLPVAIGVNRRVLLVRGSMARLMKAVPLFYVVPYIYPQYLEKIGRSDLVTAGAIAPLHADQPVEGTMNKIVSLIAFVAGYALGVIKKLSPGLDILAALESLGKGLVRASKKED